VSKCECLLSGTAAANPMMVLEKALLHTACISLEFFHHLHSCAQDWYCDTCFL
jgi:hypothetical protein